MEIKLHTEAVIDGAHQLRDYNGKCSFTHGHSWLLKIWFKGDDSLRDKVGILVDFGIVKEVKDKLDHKFINDVVDMNPTAENLTKWIYDYLKNKVKEGIEVKVRLYETAIGKETYCERGDFE